MSVVRGGNVVLILDGNDLSPFCSSTESNRKVDAVDTTCFGSSGRGYRGSLTDGMVTASGLYDSTEAGPRTVIRSRLGALATLTYRPEGSGSGAPEQTCTVLVAAYQETAALFDMVKWSAELQIAGSVVGGGVGSDDTYQSTYSDTY